MCRRLLPTLALILLLIAAGVPSGAGIRVHASLAAGGRAAVLGTLVPVKVQVPSNLRNEPFNVAQTLNVPKGARISVYARVPDARFMAVTPDGKLLVSDPADGKIVLLRPNRSGVPSITDFATGLNRPQAMVFRAIDGVTYLYVGEINEIDRAKWRKGDLTMENRQVIIPNLPFGPTADGDTHPTKDLAFGPDNKLYVSIGSRCNACTGDRTSTPRRGAIYQYNADGSGGKLFAVGLRNAEGMAFVPGTNTLWADVNNRDNIAYPFKDSSGRYGKVLQSYVDNHPPDEFTSIKQGGDYGWPYCNPNPDTASGLNNMPFDPDYQFNQTGGYNPHGSVVDCTTKNRIVKGIQAHSAPLGLTFLQGTKVPSRPRAGAVIALHGSWNRAMRTGYKVVYFPWLKDSGAGHPGAQEDLVTGWLTANGQSVWDRPVDTVVDPQGNLFISADAAGTIYKLTFPA